MNSNPIVVFQNCPEISKKVAIFLDYKSKLSFYEAIQQPIPRRFIECILVAHDEAIFEEDKLPLNLAAEHGLQMVFLQLGALGISTLDLYTG